MTELLLDADALERASEATWSRCRSLQERKSGATWQSISEEYRSAWRNGAEHTIRAYFEEEE